MNPLEKTRRWLRILPNRIRKDVVTLSAEFHPDMQIENCSSQEREKRFMEYLNSQSLDDREVILRTLIVIRLMDLVCFRKIGDYIGMKTRMKQEKFPDDVIEGVLGKQDANKEIWAKISNDWNLFKNAELNDRIVLNWYSWKSGKPLF